jgi:hypothetical protein
MSAAWRAPVRKSLNRDRRKYLGEWSLFCDTAGHIQEEPNNPIVTVAAIGIPRELTAATRTKLIHHFAGDPRKWKRGGLAGLRAVADLIIQQRLFVSICQLHRGPESSWSSYFAQGDIFVQEAAARVPGSMPYLKPVSRTFDNYSSPTDSEVCSVVSLPGVIR